jgi:Ala-tRNA(Pro) deacylase
MVQSAGMLPESPNGPGQRPTAGFEPDAATQACLLRLPSADAREADLYRRFSALGIAWTTHAHAPVFTVEEARALRGLLPGTHTKNLFLEDKKDGLWLICAREALGIDLNAFAKTIGRPRFSFGAPALLADTLGIVPGAVTPFALMNDTHQRVRAVFDAGMLAHDPVNFHPLRNDRTTAIAAADLVVFAKACGHEPLIADLPLRQA